MDGGDDDAWRIVTRLVAVLATRAAIAVGWALVLWWAWDVAAVPLVHAPRLTFWSALGVVLLIDFATAAVAGIFKRD